MSEFSISAQNYKSGRMDAFTQFHTARRLAPIFASLKDAYGAGSTDLMTGLDAAAKAISGMSDADSEYVLKACLAITQRQVGTAWSPVIVSGRMMFQDIDLPAMMQITWQVLQETLAPFFLGQPGLTSPGAVSA